MNCPDCGGTDFWDNRGNKKNPRGPDFKCKQCKKGIWEKGGAVAVQSTPPAAVALQTAITNGNGKATWSELQATYKRAAVVATKVWSEAKKDLDSTALVAAAATVFIQAMQAGMVVREPKPAPPPPPVDTYPDDWEAA